MKYSKNQKLAKDFLKWLHQDANYEKWFVVNEGYSVGATKKWEEHPMWTEGGQAAAGLPPGRAPHAGCSGIRGRASAKATEAYTKYIVTDLYAKAVSRHQGRGRREVGGNRAQEDLRGLAT